MFFAESTTPERSTVYSERAPAVDVLMSILGKFRTAREMRNSEIGKNQRKRRAERAKKYFKARKAESRAQLEQQRREDAQGGSA